MAVYLIECRICRKQYNSSTMTKVRARANNYESTHRNFWKEQKLSNQARKQKRYHSGRYVITNLSNMQRKHHVH